MSIGTREERALPNIPIDITAYGNTDNLLPHHKSPLYDSAIRLCGSLISGDADFCPTFTALHDLGYTTVLIFQPGRQSKLLRNLSDHTFFWDDMCKGHLVSPIGNDAISRLAQRIDRVRPFEPPAHLGSIGGVAGVGNAVFWDMETVGHLRNISHENANGYIHQCMVEDLEVPRQAVVTYKLYGRRHDDLPYQRYRSSDVQYIETTRSPQHKEHHMQNKLTTDILKFAYQRCPSNIVIITGDQTFSGLIHFLRLKGYKVYVLLPRHPDFYPLLRDAGTMFSVFPRS
ncbi:glutamate synthase 1 [NADH], chloroplastic isoform X1 [Tanacetum coccineum]